MADNIVITLDLKSGDFRGAFSDVENKLDDLSTKAGASFSSNFSGKIKASLLGVNKELLKTAGAVFAVSKAFSFLGESGREFAAFEEALIEVNTILPKTQKLTEQNTKTFRGFAAQFGTSAAQQVKSFYQITSSGITDSAAATRVLTSANKLAVGGVAGIDGSIKVLTSILNVYADSNISAADAADSLFTTVKLGVTTVEELSSSLGKILAPANDAGIELDTLNGLLATLTLQGNTTAENVTGLSALISALTTKSALLGKGFDINAVKTEGFVNVLKKLQERTGGSAVELNRLLGSKEAFLAFVKLSKNGFKTVTDNIDQFANKAGAANDAFKLIQRSSSFQFKQFNAGIKDLQIGIGQNLVPILLTAVRGFNGITDAIARAFGKKQDLTEVDKISEKLNQLGQQFTLLKEKEKDFGKGERYDSLRIKTAEKLNQILAERSKLRVELSKILEARRTSGDGQRVKNEIDNNAQILAARKAALEALGSIGLTETQILQQKYTQDSEKLRLALENNELTRTEFENRRLVLDQMFADQRKVIEDQAVLNSTNSFENLGAAFEITAKKMQGTAGQLAAVLTNRLTAGFGNAFQAVGKAFASGEDAGQAFLDSAKATFGELASAAGDFYIKDGIAKTVGGYPGGPALIAAGAGLKVLSGILGASGGPSSSVASGATGGGASEGFNAFDNNAIESQQDVAENKPNQSIQLVVQGNVLDSEDSAKRLLDGLNAEFQKNGSFLVDTRIAT